MLTQRWNWHWRMSLSFQIDCFACSSASREPCVQEAVVLSLASTQLTFVSILSTLPSSQAARWLAGAAVTSGGRVAHGCVTWYVGIFGPQAGDGPLTVVLCLSVLWFNVSYRVAALCLCHTVWLVSGYHGNLGGSVQGMWVYVKYSKVRHIILMTSSMGLCKKDLATVR